MTATEYMLLEASPMCDYYRHRYNRCLTEQEATNAIYWRTLDRLDRNGTFSILDILDNTFADNLYIYAQQVGKRYARLVGNS